MTILERVLCKLFHHTDIGENGDLYLRRWFIYPRYPEFKKMEPRVYLHKFHRGDNTRDLHDHPWRFTSIILKCGYWEHSFNPEWQRWKSLENRSSHGGRLRGWKRAEPPKTIRKWYGPGSILRRGAKWAHAVELAEDTHYIQRDSGEIRHQWKAGRTAWSLIRTGIKERSWGFHTIKGFCNHRHYKNGVYWCHEGEEKK